MPLAASGPWSTSDIPILMGVPVAVFPPAAPVAPVEPGAAVAADPVVPPVLEAVVALDEVFEDDPHADSRATPTRALPAMAAAPRPRLVKVRLRRVGVVRARSSVSSCCLMLKSLFSAGRGGARMCFGPYDRSRERRACHVTQEDK